MFVFGDKACIYGVRGEGVRACVFGFQILVLSGVRRG